MLFVDWLNRKARKWINIYFYFESNLLGNMKQICKLFFINAKILCGRQGRITVNNLIELGKHW